MRSARAALACLAAAAVAAAAAARGADEARSATVIGPSNLLLSQGAAALEAGQYEHGIRLTLEGLEAVNGPLDRAAGHSNLCAGYAALKQWSDALTHCNRALAIDPNNWRTFNNRAAVYVAQGMYDLAIADVESGLRIAPRSSTLRKTLQIVQEHQRAHRDRSRGAVRA